MQEYRRQMQQGVIPAAYKGLMEYMLALRTHFANRHPDYLVSGSIYQGYMDMTFFTCIPASMKPLQLKVAIVFMHDTCRFEVWLAGVNKKVQTRYWELIQAHGWNKYRMPTATAGSDSIVEHTLAESPDFSELERLTAQIEGGAVEFIEDVQEFLLAHS